jgi:outer membrane lipoprotein-sorting protein
MLKQFTLLVICGLLFCLSANAQTIDEVINKHVEARGGLEKIKAVKNLKVTAKVGGGGQQLPATVFLKRPNSIRIQIDFQGKAIIQAYDGQTGWSINPLAGSSDPQKSPQEEADQLQNQGDLEGILIDYKAKGSTIELVGKEDLEGSKVFKLKVIDSKKNNITVYLDADSYLEIKQTMKVKTQGNEVNFEFYFSDYKPVNGVLFAHATEIKVGGNSGGQLIYEKVEANVEMDDKLFLFPEKK